jgi:hypothetical protein
MYDTDFRTANRFTELSVLADDFTLQAKKRYT